MRCVPGYCRGFRVHSVALPRWCWGLLLLSKHSPASRVFQTGWKWNVKSGGGHVCVISFISIRFWWLLFLLPPRPQINLTIANQLQRFSLKERGEKKKMACLNRQGLVKVPLFYVLNVLSAFNYSLFFESIKIYLSIYIYLYTYIYTHIHTHIYISLGREDPLEEGMATHSSILAWRIPWAEEPGGLQSMGLQRVGNTEAS